jgi:aldehyde dehydrogenase (NAD+)
VHSVYNPSTGKLLTQLPEATKQNIDDAVDAARKAFDTVWGLNTGGAERGKLMMKLVDLMEANRSELAAIDALDNGSYIGFN